MLSHQVTFSSIFDGKLNKKNKKGDRNMTGKSDFNMQLNLFIWVRSPYSGCLVTWFCYQLIEKEGNRTAIDPWPHPYNMFSNTHKRYQVVHKWAHDMCPFLVLVHSLHFSIFLQNTHKRHPIAHTKVKYAVSAYFTFVWVMRCLSWGHNLISIQDMSLPCYVWYHV